MSDGRTVRLLLPSAGWTPRIPPCIGRQPETRRLVCVPVGSASRLACPSHRLRIAQRLSPKSILIVTLSSCLTPPSPEYLRCPGKTTARRSRGWHGEARLLRHLEQCSPAQIERERIGRWEWRRRIGRSFRGGGGRLGRDPELCGVVPVPAT